MSTANGYARPDILVSTEWVAAHLIPSSLHLVTDLPRQTPPSPRASTITPKTPWWMAGAAVIVPHHRVATRQPVGYTLSEPRNPLAA